jgi:hypothetical protein
MVNRAKKIVLFFLLLNVKKLCDLIHFYLIDSNWSMNIVIEYI